MPSAKEMRNSGDSLETEPSAGVIILTRCGSGQPASITVVTTKAAN